MKSNVLKTAGLALISGVSLMSFNARPSKGVEKEEVVAVNTTTLKVTVKDIKSKEGTMFFVLWTGKDGFPSELDKAYKIEKVKDFSTSASHTFKNLPYGDYAVAVFQDKDNNGELEKNFIGIPREPIAMTNMTGMGKPSFKKCTITLNSPEKNITLGFIND
ncbi:MAG: DUF2141 domain-containing protein [Bacteroidota bacterium]